MAYFRLRDDARKWFEGISEQPPFKTKFDVWYICAIAGLASGTAPEKAQTAPATDLVERVVEDFRPVSRLLIGLLVVAELRQGGIGILEGPQVRALMRKLLDPQSPNDLSEYGMRRMNAYASSGYELLAESRDQRPFTAAEFLETYVRLIRDLPRPEMQSPAAA